MSKHAQAKQNSTISISARLLILILLANILSSCVTVIQTQGPIVPTSEFTLTVQNPATQELTLVSPTEVAIEMPTITLTPEPTATVLPTEVVTEMMIPALDLESATAVEDLRKLNEMFETNKDIDNLVLAPEQIFSDFYNKVIPKEADLRFDRDDVKRYNIGEPYYYKKDNFVNIQATLMGGFTTDNGAYVLLGTENSSTGDRSIVPFQFTFGSEGRWATAGIREDSSQRKIMQYSINNLEFILALDLLNNVKENLGRTIMTHIELIGCSISQSAPEDSKVAYEKYFLVERCNSNSIFIDDPLSIDKNNLIKTPWSIFYVY